MNDHLKAMNDRQMGGVVFGTMRFVQKVTSYRLICTACETEKLVPADEAHTTRCDCETAKKQMLDQAMPTLPPDPPKRLTAKRLTAAEMHGREEWRAARARSIV
ncbi:hypothetical protein EN814_18965 [Mesorhizobium sp. M2D.F.Ca.ET.171.01.1.1]|uniref:hypothetical protein n=1 Tax=unclassified Mesorhizobium TaxID=325217 RepID=UPI0010925C86|nr:MULTISPECIES: hypothetical protein [unclassified Mesorhizobium]TGS94785.1 hypothetical protein EN821_18980 [Mesorhizobium sp. M2D.F.Ca.ET.178.01.1.1]TGT10567.1 hypothetical protein EN814_18965 [Mesorhizobium sp. M2D.F.Ca.ET.171.01.1.1]